MTKITKCTRCRSERINPGINGRDFNSDLGLCDVCYWRVRYERQVVLKNTETRHGIEEKDVAGVLEIL